MRAYEMLERDFPIHYENWETIRGMISNFGGIMDRVHWAIEYPKEDELEQLMTYLLESRLEIEKLNIRVARAEQELQEVSDMLFAVAPIPD